MKYKKIKLTVVIIILIFMNACSPLLLMSFNDKVISGITIEAGASIPEARAFFVNPESSGKLITDISAINTKKTGVIEIALEIDGRKCTSLLIIEDTIPPSAKSSEQYIFKGNEINANDFVTDIQDETQVTCSFASLPNVDIFGWQDVTVILKDEGNNETEVQSGLYIFDVFDELTIEAGTVESITAKSFLRNNEEAENVILDTESSGLNLSKIGSYSVMLKSGQYSVPVTVKIEDTILPKAEPAEQYIFKGNEINAYDFVKNIQDETQVTCSFASPPDLDIFGWQDVLIILEDEGTNKIGVNSRLYILDAVSEFILEAGTKGVLTARNFISNYIRAADISLSFDTKNDEINFSRTGSYTATLQSGKYCIQTDVKVVDTTPPEAKSVVQYIFKGNEVKAESFISDIRDATNVTCLFDSPPDLNKPGWQDIRIILTDESNNQSEIHSKLYIFDFMNNLTVEAGTTKTVEAGNFINNYIKSYAALEGEVNLSNPGSYHLTLKSVEYAVPVILTVTDTTPPVANIKNTWTYKDKPIPASNFVHNITDISPVTVRYKHTPDFSVQGNQIVYIVLEDTYKNETEYSAELTVVIDTTPPVIEAKGDFNKQVVVGGTVSYREGITVSDDYDSNVQLVIDSSGVNLNQAGVYSVIYSAADESGNKAEVKATVTVSAIDMPLVNEMADNILSKITDSKMNQFQKAKAIYDWIHNRMTYSMRNPTRELAQGAYNCFSAGTGDCYTYMAASQVLLTRAGIRSVTVQRSGLDSEHYWNLVNTGTGWHHFDVCPTPGNAVTVEQRFMFTDSQARRYTQMIETEYLYYQYDKTTVPEAVE